MDSWRLDWTSLSGAGCWGSESETSWTAVGSGSVLKWMGGRGWEGKRSGETLEMSDRSFLTLSPVRAGWEAGRAQGWTILWEEETGREGARATGRTRGAGQAGGAGREGEVDEGEVRLLRDRRASAVVEVLGDTGPFSWFSTQPPLKFLEMDFFQCLAVRGVSARSVLLSLTTTRDSGSLCSG